MSCPSPETDDVRAVLHDGRIITWQPSRSRAQIALPNGETHELEALAMVLALYSATHVASGAIVEKIFGDYILTLETSRQQE